MLGIGHVGQAITGALLRHGYHVTVAARDATSRNVKEAQARFPSIKVLPIREAVAHADFVFLAVPYDQHAGALTSAGDGLKGKIVVDCTNPVGPNFTHALDSMRGGTEAVQEVVPFAHVVKAFTIIGFDNMEDPTFQGYGKALPAMLIAGDNAEAKAAVSKLLTSLGWEPVDAGPASSSLHLEHLTLLWIKLAYVQGLGRHFVWALLRK